MFIQFIFRRIYLSVGHLSWAAFAWLTFLHAALTFVGLRIAGEVDLIEPANFIYYYFTTASTIGYGDLSPQSPAGRVFVALWLFPGALIFFATFLGKLTRTAAETWRRNLNGQGDFSDATDITLLIGYDPTQTPLMIDEIMAGRSEYRDVILLSDRDVGIDLHRRGVRFVRAESLSSQVDLRRAGCAGADRIVIYHRNDDVALSAAMAAAAINRRAHMVVHFESQEKADILRAHTPAVCIVGRAADILVREMEDPGASAVLGDLSSVRTSVTVYSLACPRDDLTAGDLHDALHTCGATFLAARAGQGDPLYNVPPAVPMAGHVIFYVADRRLSSAEILASLSRPLSLSA